MFRSPLRRAVAFAFLLGGAPAARADTDRYEPFVSGLSARCVGPANMGGRVTELVARPLLQLLFPKLTDIAQPLGGDKGLGTSPCTGIRA